TASSTSRIVDGGTWARRNVSRPTVAAAIAKTTTAASTAKIQTTTANGNPGAGWPGHSPVRRAGHPAGTGATAPAGAGLVVVGTEPGDRRAPGRVLAATAASIRCPGAGRAAPGGRWGRRRAARRTWPA